MKRFLAVLLTALIVNLTNPTAALAFYTDIGTHWAKNSIESLSYSGYIQGYPDGTFRPDHSITKSEFLTVLLRCLNLSPSYNYTWSESSHWAQAQINEAIRLGIIIPSEYPRGFSPDQYITRGEAAAMIVRSLGRQPDYNKLAFQDWNQLSASPYAGYIKVAHDEGIITGYPDGYFKPYNSVTRAQACTILSRLLSKNYRPANYIYSPYNQSLPVYNFSRWISRVAIDGKSLSPDNIPLYIAGKKSAFNLTNAEVIDPYTLRIGSRNYHLIRDDISLLWQGRYYNINRIDFLNNQTTVVAGYYPPNTNYRNYWYDLSLDDISAVYTEKGQKITSRNLEDLKFRIEGKSTRYDLDEIAINPDNNRIEINGQDYPASRIIIRVEKTNSSRIEEMELKGIRVSNSKLILDCYRTGSDIDADSVRFYDKSGKRFNNWEIEDIEIYLAGKWVYLDDSDIEWDYEDEQIFYDQTLNLKDAHLRVDDEQYEVYKTNYSSKILKIYLDTLPQRDYAVGFNQVCFFENGHQLNWDVDEIEIKLAGRWYDFDEVEFLGLKVLQLDGEEFDLKGTILRRSYSSYEYRITDTRWNNSRSRLEIDLD